MDKYLTQKIPVKSTDELQKSADFLEQLKQLKNSPVEMNSDLTQNIAKDLPVDRINTRQLTPVGDSLSKIADTHKKIIDHRIARAVAQGTPPVEESVLNYGDWLKPKVPSAVETVYDAGAMKKEYQAMQKAAKTAGRFGKKGLAAIGPIGAGIGAVLAGSAEDALAGFVPGGVDSAGEGSDLPVEDDTAQIKMLAETATDPNVRRQAIQALRTSLR